MNLKNYIHFRPQGDLLFCDLSDLMSTPEAVDFVVGEFVSQSDNSLTAVVGVGGVGFVLGSAVANQLGVPFYSMQKKSLTNVNGTDFLPIPASDQALSLLPNNLDQNDHVLIIDELIATGKTLQTAHELIRKTGAQVDSIAVIVELTKFSGRGNFPSAKIITLIKE